MKENMVDGKKDPVADEKDRSQRGASEEDRAILEILKKIAGKWGRGMEQVAGEETETFILPPGGLKAHPQSDEGRIPPEKMPDTVILTPSEPDGEASSPPTEAYSIDTDDIVQKVSPRDELPDTVILRPPDGGAKPHYPSGETDVKDSAIGERNVSAEDVLAETIIQRPSGLKDKTKGPIEEEQSETRRSIDENASTGKTERIAEEKKPSEELGGEDFSVETVIIKPGKTRKKEDDGFED